MRPTPSPSEALPPDANPPEGTPESHRSRIGELFRRYNDALLRSLAARVGSMQGAQDIAQEAYVKLLALDRPGAVSFLASVTWSTGLDFLDEHGKERPGGYRRVRLTTRPRENHADRRGGCPHDHAAL